MRDRLQREFDLSNVEMLAMPAWQYRTLCKRDRDDAQLVADLVARVPHNADIRRAVARHVAALERRLTFLKMVLE